LSNLFDSLEPEWHNPLGLTLIYLLAIRAIRQVYPDFTFPLALLQVRHTYVLEAQTIQDDYMLVGFMMDLDPGMVCYPGYGSTFEANIISGLAKGHQGEFRRDEQVLLGRTTFPVQLRHNLLDPAGH
jgi:hypothetical protein